MWLFHFGEVWGSTFFIADWRASLISTEFYYYKYKLLQNIGTWFVKIHDISVT